MMTHTRLRKKQWQQLIEAQQSSGLSQKAFCQKEGLSLTTFSFWKRKLKHGERSTLCPSDSSRPSSNAWIELPAGIPAANSWCIELDLGNGVCLRLNQTG